jgi:2-dehydropantoate 2-reductase
MKTGDLSFLVVGAGAVGGITASLLKKNGYNVEIVCKYDDYASVISGKGFNVTGASGDFNISMPAYSSVNTIGEKKDIVLLATKATDMIEAAKEIMPVLKESGYIVSLQNGFCEEDLAAVAGNQRVIGCIVGWGATMEVQGNLYMSSAGDFILGYSDRRPDEFLISLANTLSDIVPSRTTDNLSGHRYSKLIVNSCITSLGAICGLSLGVMLSDKKSRNIFIEIVNEAMLVGNALKINVEVFGGKLNFYKFIKGEGLLSKLRRHIVISIIGFKYRNLKSSSLQSHERGKPTEIDYLNGFIVKNAKTLGIDVPVNTAIVKMIHEIENGSRIISKNNFKDSVFDRFS